MKSEAILLDGTKIAEKIRAKLKQALLKYPKNHRPGLAAVLVGDNPASKIYVGRKEKALQEVGFYSEVHHVDSRIKEIELLSLIQRLNESSKIDGILVQLPLPLHINPSKILYSVAPEKDVDGFHPHNLGHLVSGDPIFIPCTPKGILTLLKSSSIEISGKKTVVVGRSLIVGKPMALLLLQENATVTICHSKTKNLQEECLVADILIVAIGKAGFIKSSFVKSGAVVVDVGIHRQNNKLIGDVDFDKVRKKAAFITPVPGGVGPMTIAMLLQNTWESYLRRV